MLSRLSWSWLEPLKSICSLRSSVVSCRQRLGLIGRVERSERQTEFADRGAQIPGGPIGAGCRDFGSAPHHLAFADQAKHADVAQALGERAGVEPRPCQSRLRPNSTSKGIEAVSTNSRLTKQAL